MIPKITDPLGKHWIQPNADNMLFDNTHVVMSEKDFNLLEEYSCSNPSGVYQGKMWVCRSKEYGDFLRWYEKDPVDSTVMAINQRSILVVKEGR